MMTENSGLKRISINNLKSGMVLALDLVKQNGQVLIPRETTLTEYNVVRIKESEFKHAYIKTDVVINPPQMIQVRENAIEVLTTPIEKRKEFTEFKQTYDAKVGEIKNQIKNISDGGTINLQQLNTLTGSIMDNLKCKGDVLTYIGFMKNSDEHTFNHSTNVSLLCNLFARWIGYSHEEVMYLTAAGMLHDIGKTKIPDEILNKEGKLTEDEFKIMKNHTTLGYDIIGGQSIPDDIKFAALMHHEKIDGSGYPSGRLDNNINKYAKIVGICDIYDAMTANRVYRKKISPFEVIKTFENRSYGELDTKFLTIFLKNIAYNYIGCFTSLTDGRIAEVVFVNQIELSRPIVRIGREIIDLAENRNLSIVEVL